MTVVYHTAAVATRWAFRRVSSSLTVEGAHHIPESGPFMVLPNHESFLDPFFLLAFSPRPLHAMTKSTQFSFPPVRLGLSQVLAFPVRRYRTDAQAVRVVLRTLDEGKGVCIYPEGERSWDATVQRFRRGTLRVMLEAGVPVIPCGMSGIYDLWPRWSRRPRRGPPLVLRFGEPLHFGPFEDRFERDAALPEAEALLLDRIRELSGEAERCRSWDDEDAAIEALLGEEQGGG
jgi:1-acyl-sn-glycerol-3-phosphate acyltransferase